ncbi:hypothetical protein [Paenibacillus oralis]|uniref:hypothetical protein n=1 Tax=Paenibacillus oralis TaxID=2490856 RepID=UPI0015AD225E|nr:hypothetical protein [Paenibacillus oralis]
MSGDTKLLSEYVNFIERKEIEIIRGLWNIMIVANRFEVDVDHILAQFETEPSNLHKQKGNEIYNDQNTADQHVSLLYELAQYYLYRGHYEKGFRYLFNGMEISAIIKEPCNRIAAMKRFTTIAFESLKQIES